MRKKQIILVEVLCLLSLLMPFKVCSVENNTGFFNRYQMYLDIELDIEKLNNPLIIEEPVNIDLEVFYKTNIPDFYFNNIIGRIFYFKTAKKQIPTSEICLSIEKKAYGYTSFISPESFTVDISNELQSKIVRLTIIPSKKARADPKNIRIKAVSNNSRNLRLREGSCEKIISFSAEYYADIDIDLDNEIEISNKKSTEISINIKSNSNKESTIELNVQKLRQNLRVINNPEIIKLRPGETKNITLIVKSRENFNQKTIDIEFIVNKDPKQNKNSEYVFTKSISFVNINYSHENQKTNIPLIFGVIFFIVFLIIIFILYLRKK